MRQTGKKNRSFVSRRSFLQQSLWLGAGAAAVPWLPLSSEANSPNYPKRLLLLFQPNGTIPENWWPTGTVDDWQLGKNLAALEPHREHLIFLDGVYKYGQRFDQEGGPGNEHRKGISMLWTGSRNITVGGEDWNGGVSIDQAIAAASAGQTPFRSLELGVRSGESFYGNRMIYSGPGKPLPPEPDPNAAFKRLFQGGGAAPGVDVEQVRAQRQSVIDAAREELERVKAKVSSADRHKMEAHLEALRALEGRLAPLSESCGVPPEAPPPSDALDTDTSRAQIDNLVLALTCDLTRVGSLQYGWANTLQSATGAPHHDLSHRIADQHDKNAMQKMEQIDAWYAEQVAYLIERLSSVSEGDGTLLDNTLIVWSNEIANGVTYAKPGKTHLMGRMPWMMAGGANFAFETGRYLRYAQPEDMNETDPAAWELMHHRVLVSIAQAFGLDVDTYGDLDPGSGPAPLL